MKLVDVRLTGLCGVTVEGGWAEELKPEDNLHTIVEVVTDEGLIGVGSAMTSVALVHGAVKLIRPLLIGERADEPARVTEKLRQNTFWQGRGGGRRTRHQRHRHCLVGPNGQDLQPAGGPAARRVLSQPDQAVRLAAL
jgi:L-alanine-DL-glutamate epimerase-like enolase superfamily enzyme